MTWLAFLWMAAAAIGYGAGLVWIWRSYVRTPVPFVSTGEIGLAGLFVLDWLGILLHFFVPLSPAVSLVVTSIGVILLVLSGRRLLHGSKPIYIVFVFLCLITFCLQSQIDLVQADGGIYYVPTIVWNSASPLIPGSGNIHSRLGFNTTALVLASLLRLPVVLWKSAFLLNALFALLVMAAFFERLRDALQVSGLNRLSTMYGLLMIGGFCASNFMFNGDFGSLTGDFGPCILACLTGYLLIRAVEDQSTESACGALLLASFALILKLSALPLFAGALVVLIFVPSSFAAARRTTFATFALVAVVFLSWTLRGVLLSGCVAYPEVRTCLALPWTVPAKLAIHDSQYVLDFARGSIQDPHTVAEWVRPLITQLWPRHDGRLLIGLCGLGLILCVAGRLLGRRIPARFWRAALGPAATGIAWIAFAVLRGPALRFYSGGAFMLAFTLFGLGLLYFRDLPIATALKPWIPATLCFLLAVQGGLDAARYLSSDTRNWPHFQRFEVTKRMTRKGVSVYVSRTESCWDAPLPCTPFFDSALEKVPWLDRFYFRGQNTEVYRNGFPPRPEPSPVSVPGQGLTK